MTLENPRNIRWGIIGLGKIANKFAQDLRKTKGAQLYAVASRNQEKADSFALQHNSKFVYYSYAELAKNPNIDVVYIATPHSFHKEHTILCLSHSKAVLCEKPFAMNLEEAEKMIAVAKTNNVLLMEGLWTYFLPHYQFALQELASKKFGTIVKLEADFGFAPYADMETRLFKKSLGGGSLLDVGIYPVFCALSTLGKPIDIDAKATFFENGVDTSCEMVFNYDNGVKAFLKSSIIEKTATEAIFHCEHGIIKINSRFHEPSTVTLIQNGNKETSEFGYSTFGFNYEIAHINELIRNGQTESPIMTHEFTRNLIKLLDDVRHLIGLRYE
ncbi:MAG TPA: Gfo/Idh/MocA family oxidoreductase [Aquaticitalea sp.]|nr:Gfo/Idh/MocA family oxidoreductase [Aquaticitalea sp.]